MQVPRLVQQVWHQQFLRDDRVVTHLAATEGMETPPTQRMKDAEGGLRPTQPRNRSPPHRKLEEKELVHSLWHPQPPPLPQPVLLQEALVEQARLVAGRPIPMQD